MFFEQWIKNFLSFESKVGIIGAGTNFEDQRGLFVKAGPKFKLKPDYVIKGMKGRHLLDGGYLRPEIAVSFFSRSNYMYDYITGDNNDGRSQVQSVAIILNYGIQKIIGNTFLIDTSVGIGYGFSSQDGGYDYGFATGGGDFPIAFSAGLSIGFIVK